MNKPLLSICISVHNTEKYLVRCLDSITTQSYKNYEIVLVNNGSTDNSLSLMEKYREEHPSVSIFIYSQEDRGLAQGRQTGINNAKGEYITFIDADDYYIGNALEILMATIQREQVDIVEMQTLKDNKVVSSPFKGKQAAKDVLNCFFEHTIIPPMLWLRVYKSKLFNQDTMPKFYTNNEDQFTFPCLLYLAESIFFIEKPLHIYFTGNEGSVIASYNSKKTIDPTKLLQKKKNTLHISEFIKSKIGFDIETIFPTFSFYQNRMLITFIFSQPLQISYSNKIQIIQKECRFASKEDVVHFVENHLQQKRLDRLIKIFGLRLTYELYHRFLWRFK